MGNTALSNNVFNTALFFEGGSMRAAYTSAVAVYLLEQGVYFDNVYGISAGSSNAVNYMSRDIKRTAESFTIFCADPRMGDWKTFLRGKGLFDAEYIYQKAGLPDGPLPYDYETFAANPGKTTIVSFDRDTGEDLYFTKEDLSSVEELMIRVRASSTLPVVMPSPVVDGRHCYDGGFATGGGLPIEKILADGHQRMVVVRTRKRGYRKEPGNGWARFLFRKYPKMRNALLNRHIMYNAACQRLDALESLGQAYVFYSDDLTLSGDERDLDKLQANFDAGYAQVKRDFGEIMRFIEAGE